MEIKFEVGDRVLYNKEEEGVVVSVMDEGPYEDSVMYEVSLQSKPNALKTVDAFALSIIPKNAKPPVRPVIEPEVTFHFFDRAGRELRLTTGAEHRGAATILYWRMTGTKLPFPVRSGSWFMGMNKATMFASCVNAGYKLKYTVYERSGRVIVEEPLFEEQFEDVVKTLLVVGSKPAVHFVMVYKHCDIHRAKAIINEIVESK